MQFVLIPEKELFSIRTDELASRSEGKQEKD